MGTNVAAKKEINNSDCGIYEGKLTVGIKNPTNIDVEKSGFGNNNNPTNKPAIIEI